MTGHYFGGMTAIKVTRDDQRIKVCGVLDPWLYPYHKEILQGDFKLQVPIIAVASSLFHINCNKDFPSWEAMKTLLNNSKDSRQENIIMNRVRHMHQSDFACLPLELYAFEKVPPILSPIEAYQLHCHLLLSFFEKTSCGTGLIQEGQKKIDKMSKEWLNYDIKF